MFKTPVLSLFEQGSILARVFSRCLNWYACVCSGILGGLSIVTMAIYLYRTQPHPPELLPRPCAWSFLKGFHCSLILLVPGNSYTSPPKAELRGNVFPKEESWYPKNVGPELAEAWERHVPLKSFDKATWASGEHFEDEGPWVLNWQQLHRNNGLISSLCHSSLGTHNLLPFPLGVLDSQDQIRQVREHQWVHNTLRWNSRLLCVCSALSLPASYLFSPSNPRLENGLTVIKL